MYQFFITNVCVCWENMENDAMQKVIEYTYRVRGQWYTHTNVRSCTNILVVICIRWTETIFNPNNNIENGQLAAAKSAAMKLNSELLSFEKPTALHSCDCGTNGGKKAENSLINYLLQTGRTCSRCVVRPQRNKQSYRIAETISFSSETNNNNNNSYTDELERKECNELESGIRDSVCGCVVVDAYAISQEAFQFINY